MGAFFIPDEVELLVSRVGGLDHLVLKTQERVLSEDTVHLGTIGNRIEDRLVVNHEASHPLGYIIGSIFQGQLLPSIFDYRAELVLGGVQNLTELRSQAGRSIRYTVGTDSRVNIIARGLQVLIGDYLHRAGVVGVIESEVREAEGALNNYFQTHSSAHITYATPRYLKMLVSFEGILEHLDICRIAGWSDLTLRHLWHVDGYPSEFQDAEFLRLGRDDIVAIFKLLMVPRHVLERLDRFM